MCKRHAYLGRFGRSGRSLRKVSEPGVTRSCSKRLKKASIAASILSGVSYVPSAIWHFIAEILVSRTFSFGVLIMEKSFQKEEKALPIFYNRFQIAASAKRQKMVEIPARHDKHVRATRTNPLSAVRKVPLIHRAVPLDLRSP